MITITKNKIYQSPFSLKNTRPDSDSIREIDVSDIIFSMGEDVELGEDVLFKQIFDIIIYHKDFFNILFSTEMNHLQIDDYISDYEQEFDLIVPNQEYKLQLSWDSVVYEIDNEIEYYDCLSFEAFGKIDTTIEGENYPISISFISLSEIREKTIVLNNTFKIQNDQNYYNESEVVFKANYRPFTLSDLIRGILIEISYYGTPEERDSAKKEAEIKNKEIIEWIDNEKIYDHIFNYDLRDEINEMIDEEYDDSDDITFWDTLYPKDKPTGKSSKERIDNAIISMSEESKLSLEQQLKEADDSENYEKAAKIMKLIKKRDQINSKKNKM